jgi:hypothetical protein
MRRAVDRGAILDLAQNSDDIRGGDLLDRDRAKIGKDVLLW